MCCAGTKGYQDLLKKNKGHKCDSFEGLYLDSAAGILSHYFPQGTNNVGLRASATINIFPVFTGIQEIGIITKDLNHVISGLASVSTNSALNTLAAYLIANTSYTAIVSGNVIRINAPVGEYNNSFVTLVFTYPPFTLYPVRGMFTGGQFTQWAKYLTVSSVTGMSAGDKAHTINSTGVITSINGLELTYQITTGDPYGDGIIMDDTAIKTTTIISQASNGSIPMCLSNTQINQVIENVNIMCGCNCTEWNIDAPKFKPPVQIQDVSDEEPPPAPDNDIINFADFRDPNNTDDITKGYTVNSLGTNLSTGGHFICRDPSPNNAIWDNLAGG